MPWDRTHGKRAGAYLRAGSSEFYVRREEGGWAWFIDGIRMGVADREEVAKAAGEAAGRAMSRTHTGAMAAPAGQAGRAA